MLLQLEIITFFASFFYIIYYFSDSIVALYKKRQLETLERIQRQKLRKNQIKAGEKTQTALGDLSKKESKKETLVSDKHGEQIRESLRELK